MEKLLLFDVDGVIIDSFDHLYKDALGFIQSRGGKRISEEDYRRCFEGNAIENILKLANISLGENGPDISDDEKNLFFQAYHKTTLFSEMIPVIKELAKSNVLVVVTSTFVEFVVPKFHEFGIEDYFAAYLGPKSGIYKDQKIQMAMKEFAASPKNTVFVSDTSGDLKEAKKVGVKTVAVTWGYHDRATLEKASPDAIVEAPNELLALLNQ